MVTNVTPVASSPAVPPNRRLSMASLLAALLGALAGATIWAASPYIGGSHEVRSPEVPSALGSTLAFVVWSLGYDRHSQRT